jgi:N-acetylmuramoyl-L-alanine amidase
MRLRQQLLTKNDCYKAGRTIQVKGVMVHSTGANNPKVCRYVPGDAEMGLNTADNHWDRPDLTKCVHAFVGKFADGGVGTVQTLPWSHRGWHAGGAANNTHIGFEICEDGLENPVYFAQVYQEAAELTAMLCRQYGLDPLADGVVICHQEGFRRGVASNHADVLHWFPKMGKPMDDFRAEVARLMKGEDDVTYEQWKEFMEQYRQELGQQPAPDWGEKELERAKELGLTDGSRPQDLATRQEVASMIIRAKA